MTPDTNPGSLAFFLQMSSPEEIAQYLQDIHYKDSPTSRTGQTAAVILASKRIAETSERLDTAATKLQFWGLGIAGVSLLVSIAALVVSLVRP